MYEDGYNKLFWGMMFIIFNINIGLINLQPNFIVCILILSGINILKEQHKIFEKGKLPAVVLTIITLKDIINFGKVNYQSFQLEIDNLLLLTFEVFEILISIYLLFIICKGIYLLAEERGFRVLSGMAKSRFNFYLGISMIILFYTPFSINLSRDLNMLMVVGAVINLIALLRIAWLFRNSRTQLGERVINNIL